MTGEDQGVPQELLRQRIRRGELSGSNRLISKAYFDPLGRPFQSIDPSGKIIRKAYRYGSAGKTYELVSNPYTSTTDSTMGWSLTTSDVPTPSTSPVKTVTKYYSGSTLPAPWGNNTTLTGTTSTALTVSSCVGAGTIVTDAALNATTYCSDALGRLSTVTEADSTTTSYSYDGRGNLTAANIAGQVRAFAYDSLDRLTKACNPETGTANCAASPLPDDGLERFTYDNNGNVLTRTDARGVVTTLTGYDALNRPSSKSYTTSGDVETTASVTWTYDTNYKGMLSSVTSGGLITGYTYDAFGRVKTSTQTIGGKSYSFAYEYSSADRLLSIQYPSGRKISYGYDASGRLSSVKNFGATSSYASIDYSATNGIPTMSFGNGIVETTSWNDRFQMTGLSAAKAGASAALSLGFYYCPGLAVSCTSGNNGMLRAQSIVGGSLNATQTYSYDAVNKIKDASESGTGTWLETYRYNNTNGTVGNVWVEPDSPLRTGLPKLTSETAQGASWYTGRSRLNLWGADDSGNVTGVHSMLRTFKYDAENRQTSATIDDVTTTYRYDGLGQRVQKIAGTTTTTYVYDAGGNLAAEYSTAIVASGCGTAVCYVTTDHLGSTRLLTDANGNPARRYDYSPFGVELFVGTGGRSVNDGYTSSTDGFNPKFTGQMRDSETGLDFFNARYYSPAQGRFQSPDPGNAGADLASPQTWNMYAYVNNSPLNYTDPDGKGIWSVLAGIGAGVGTFFGTGGNLAAAIRVGTTVAGIGRAVETVAAGGIPGTFGSALPSFGDFTSCGGPLGNCGTLGKDPWHERTGLDTVHDPNGYFIFDLDQYTNGRRVLANGDVEIYGLWGSGSSPLANSGRLASPVTDPRFIGGWYAGSAALGYLAPIVEPYIGGGLELSFGKGRLIERINLFGDWRRVGEGALRWYERLPHYHRRFPGPGGSINRHRPWQSPGIDKLKNPLPWWKRF